MTQLKLSYFDFHGGRGEVARLIMFKAGITFEDHRIPMANWPSHKSDMPFGALPVLFVDGEGIAQSNAINRYLGKLAGLYPDNALDALRCDEVMDAIEDTTHLLVATFTMPEDEKKKTRDALCEGPFRHYLQSLNSKLVSTGGEYFAGGKLSVADLKMFMWMRSLTSGVLDYIPTDLADDFAPAIAAQFQRMNNLDFIQNYYRQFE